MAREIVVEPVTRIEGHAKITIQLDDHGRVAGARVLTHHQLVPELAEDVGRASLVVLVDASTQGDPGSVSVRQIGPPSATPTTWSHHLDPETLAGLAKTLYGAVPPMVLVSVAAGSLADGDRLSSTLEQVLPEVVETVAGVVTGQRRA